MSTVWIKHPGLDAISEVPATALPVWRQSGWDLLTPEENAAREQALVDERVEAEEWAAAIRAQQPAPESPVLADEDTGKQAPKRTKRNERSGTNEETD